MAKVDITQRNGQRMASRRINNNPVDDVVDGAKRLYELMMKDDPSVQTGQGQNIPHAVVEGQTAKRISKERRRKGSRSPETRKTRNKKSKNALEDDGSRTCKADDSRGQKTSEQDGKSLGSTSRQGAPNLTLVVGGRAPLAKPEDSTVTPEAEPDVDQKMRSLRCRSRTIDTDSYNEAGDDEPDHGASLDDEDYDDLDGGSPDAAAKEREKVLTEIALKLRKIGDTENSNIASGEMTRSASTVSLSMAIDGIQDLISNLTYEKFQDVVNRNMGSEPGVQQVAVIFRLAGAAVRHFGNGTKAAMDLRKIALDYFSDNVATWVAENGGWEEVAQRL